MEAISLQKSGTISDEKMVNYVHENLKNLGMDKVETMKYKVEVVSLDPETPSTITVSKAGKEKFVLKQGEEDPEATEERGGSGGGRPLLSVPGRAVVRILEFHVIHVSIYMYIHCILFILFYDEVVHVAKKSNSFISSIHVHICYLLFIKYSDCPSNPYN